MLICEIGKTEGTDGDWEVIENKKIEINNSNWMNQISV